MPKARHLRSAPITEAMIDIRVKASPNFKASALVQLGESLRNRFPKAEERRGGKISFQFAPSSPSPPVVEDLGLQGLLLRTEDEKTAAQFRNDGFTLNRLRPYSSWEEIFPVAMELWLQYAAATRPQVATRLALRYINHFEMPSTVEDFDELLSAGPVIPAGLPQFVSSFLTRVTIHDPQTKAAAHISQTLEVKGSAQRPTLLSNDTSNPHHSRPFVWGLAQSRLERRCESNPQTVSLRC